MGRKRSHRDETRTKIISARLTHDTYELISEHAERLGLTRAGYVEHLIENRPLRIVRGQMDELSVPLINELKRIGNNLNQIAHARNAGSDIDPSHFHTVLADIIRVICRNELTRRHYAEAYTEVVGQTRDDNARDPAMRGMLPPVTPANDNRGEPKQPPLFSAAPRKPADDNPAPGPSDGFLQVDKREQPARRPATMAEWIEQQFFPPVTQDARQSRSPWSSTPHHLSSVSRHDSAPQSAWSKLLRRLHLHPARRRTGQHR